MESDEMGKGHPVFVSLCLSHFELQRFLLDAKLGGMNIRTIPFEMFTVYDGKNEIHAGSVIVDSGDDFMAWIFKYNWNIE